MSKVRYHQAVDGEWFAIKKRGFYDMCCDCGLVHIVDYRIIEGRLEIRSTRHKRATAAARRKFKFEREE